VYFVTICAIRGARPLTGAQLAQAIVGHLRDLDARGRAYVHWYCLMPDHLHVVLSCVARGPNLVRAVQELKTKTTHAARRMGLRVPIWQRGFYDHIARTEEDLAAACAYIFDNPVRAGLVAEASAWAYSGCVSPLRL